MGFACLVQPAHPQPSGDQTLGCVRARLPPTQVGQENGLLAQVHYPAEVDEVSERRFCGSKSRASKPSSTDPKPFPWFRREVVENIANSYKVSVRLMNSVLGDCKQLDGSHRPIENGKKWPIILFSSGLFGSCEMYTQFCRELASAGAIVIAVEHEDGSQVFAKNNSGEVIDYKKQPEDSDIVSFRHQFLETRVTELESSVAQILSATNTPCEALSNPEQALLARVLRCGDPDRFLLCGHSFGCSGIVRYLRKLDEQQKFCPFQGTLLLDLWGGPLTEEDRTHRVQVPCVFLLSEAFAGDGAPVTKRIVGASGERCLGIASFKGTQHQWISESHYFFPGWLLRRLGIMGTADFRKAHVATIKASQLAIEAFLDPTLQTNFQQSLLAIDQDLIAPV